MVVIDVQSDNRAEEDGQSDDGLCQHNSSPTDEIVRRGKDAMQRLRRGFDDWMDIAEALQVGRAESMRAAHTNEPKGKRYDKAMGEWLFAQSFHVIDKSARNRLLECLKHRAEIEKWRATLTEGERWRFNHPDTVLRKWKAATIVPDPNPSPKKSAVAKLKESVVRLEEDNHRMRKEIERGGGDLCGVVDLDRKKLGEFLDDALVVWVGDDAKATPWFSSKIKPIFEGSVQNDEAAAALAFAQFKRACAELLPLLTTKNLDTVREILRAMYDLEAEVEDAKFKAKCAAADAKRIKWEVSHPEEAKNKARDRAQDDAMEGDMEDAKADAKEFGERWADVKNDWIADWPENNWDEVQEAEFEKDFNEKWAREHGVAHPGSIKAAVDDLSIPEFLKREPSSSAEDIAAPRARIVAAIRTHVNALQSDTLLGAPFILEEVRPC